MALRVKPCSHQDGKARYSGKDDDKAPVVAKWRNNLTALSQYRNLLFIAYVDQIHVFEPGFPSQTLPKKPELIIAIPESRPGLTGYLDSEFPHAINHLIIGDIGNEEVLVACCDDGDVVGYTVRSIERLLETLPDLRTRSTFSSRNPEIAPTIPGRPFLLENVGKSAWGLATHKTQRLLAVSSNSKEISVFVFALGQSGLPYIDMKINSELAHLEANDEPFLSEDKIWPKVRTGSPRDRSKDFIIVLSLHDTNIPNIAFYDSDRDFHETYLASTDIEGKLLIWEIWSGAAIVDTQLVLGSNALRGTRGWGLACVDPRVSQLTQSQEDTYGCSCLTDISETFLDTTEGARYVTDSSLWHPAYSRLVSVPSSVPIQNFSTNQQPETISEDVDQEDADEPEVVDGDSDEVVLEESYDPENEGLASTDEIMGDNEAEGENDDDDDSEESEESQDSQATEVWPDGSLLHSADHPGSSGINGNMSPSPPLMPARRSRSSREVREILLRKAIITPPLPFSLLHTTEMDIHLWRNIAPLSDRRINVSNGLQSRVICRKAIQQAIPPNLRLLQQIERLNMVLQIPELGIVAVGNQAGRVGILTMTRWQSVIESGFKIEFILPFHSQEKQGCRPDMALMGVAVGPIQGHETKPDNGSALETPEATVTGPRIATRSSRRFRLMMVYYDHTLLSYEIFRGPEGDEILVV